FMAVKHHGLIDAEMSERLAELFKALSDPTRVRIIARLAGGEACVHELSDELELGQSTVSHQLRLLRHLRIVRSRKNGRHVFYQLDDEHVRDLFERARAHLTC
ncbi:MAG TPA: metalloregulator ArsR/SmtB family transcription factor, partial [Polyangiaceae bacterium]|nr:metalloregulator ArsR/SmtB family transcription factor [Polyangiaceae bacterium]